MNIAIMSLISTVVSLVFVVIVSDQFFARMKETGLGKTSGQAGMRVRALFLGLNTGL